MFPHSKTCRLPCSCIANNALHAIQRKKLLLVRNNQPDFVHKIFSSNNDGPLLDKGCDEQPKE
jgi:hypothetical protein